MVGFLAFILALVVMFLSTFIATITLVFFVVKKNSSCFAKILESTKADTITPKLLELDRNFQDFKSFFNGRIAKYDKALEALNASNVANSMQEESKKAEQSPQTSPL